MDTLMIDVEVKRKFMARSFTDTCTIHNTDLAHELIQNYLRATDLMPMFNGTGRRITHEEFDALLAYAKVVDLEVSTQVFDQEYRKWLRTKYRDRF